MYVYKAWEETWWVCVFLRVGGQAGRLIVTVCTCFDCKMTRHTHYIHILIYIHIFACIYMYICAQQHTHSVHIHTYIHTGARTPWQNVYTKKKNALTFGIMIFLPISLHMDYLPLFRSLRHHRAHPRCYN